MSPRKFFGVLAAAAGCTLGTVASAATVVIDFEGLANQAVIGNYYEVGGAGPDLGVSFTDAVALVDEDAGGTGKFENEPSPDTVMFFTANNAKMNVSAGFTTALSFNYTNKSTTGLVASLSIWSGLNGQGSQLASVGINLLAGCNSPNDYCTWDVGFAEFSGTAMSVVFATNRPGFVGFDNVTFGSKTPGTDGGNVPEPAPLMLLGLALTGLALQRRVIR